MKVEIIASEGVEELTGDQFKARLKADGGVPFWVNEVIGQLSQLDPEDVKKWTGTVRLWAELNQRTGRYPQ